MLVKRKLVILVGLALTVVRPSGAVSESASPESQFSARLRQALPLPEASLDRKMALSLGISFSPVRGFYMSLGAEAVEARPRAEVLRRILRRVPRDAGGYEILGGYEAYLGDKAQAQRDYVEAAALYRQQMVTHGAPREEKEVSLVGLSRSLNRAGRTLEAETLIRRGLKAHLRSWRLWDALGQVQMEQAQAGVSGSDPQTAAGQALRHDRDACASFDRAVTLAPKQGMAYAARAEFRGFDHPDLLNAIRRQHGEKLPPFNASVLPSALADFQHAARLLPDDPYAIAYPVWLDVSAEGFFLLHLPFPSQAAWNAMPTSTRRAARDAIQRLTRLARGHGRLALRADIALGFLLYETQREVAPAEADLRRGLAGPDHQEAAEMLMHIMSLENQDRKLAAFCQAESLRRETPRLHLIAAWAEKQQAHWSQAQTQAARALILEPCDPTDLLTLAAITLKADTGQSGLAKASTLLMWVQQGLQDASQLDTTSVEREEYRVIHAYSLALSGDIGVAEQEMRTVLTDDPNASGAAQGLAIVMAERRRVEK